MSRFMLLIAAAAILLGAQTPLGGPSLGFVFDARGQALRPILGIPGASILGDPLNAAAPISTATLSLKQNVAIVNDGGWQAVTLATANPIALPAGLPISAQVAVSETGAAAAFYDKDNHALTVVTRISSSSMASSMAANPVSLDTLPGAITAIAIGDDGSLLVSASIPTGIPTGGEALFWIDPSGGIRQLASLQATASILLWNQGASALVVDRGGNQIWKLQDPGGNAAITLLASDADGVSSPAGAALSTDGNQLWIANAGARTVLGINLNTRDTVTLNCAFDLKTLVPLPNGVSFRLNHLDREPLWILDTTPGADPRVVFVPALGVPASVEVAQ